MKKLYFTSNFYLVLALVAGVFYREFTKFNDFTGVTVLGKVHSHIFALGFLFFLVVLLLDKAFEISKNKLFNIFYYLFNIGFIGFIFTMVWRGILQVKGLDFAGLSHIAGLFHAILGVSLIMFSVCLYKALDLKNK